VLGGAEHPWRPAGTLVVLDGLQDRGPARRQAYAERLCVGEALDDTKLGMVSAIPGANLMADISSLADVGSALSANCS
jgi:hypothetical protein